MGGKKEAPRPDGRKVPNFDANPKLTLKLVRDGIRDRRDKPATYGIFGDPGR